MSFIAFYESYFGEGKTASEAVDDLLDIYGGEPQDMEQSRVFEIKEEFDVKFKASFEFIPLPKGK